MAHSVTSTYRPGRGASRLALTALLAVVAGCRVATPVTFDADESGTSVHDFMESAGEVEAITLSDVYDRDVSDVMIACAYTGAEHIRRELGFDWRGAQVLERKLMMADGLQAVIALRDGEVVESEVINMDVLYLCHEDLDSPTVIDAGTTVKVSWSPMPWWDGTTNTTKRIPVARLQ